MAREWQPASSFSVLPQEIDAIAGDTSAWSRSVARNWSATRGAVLWEGPVSLAGSFPGFAVWGSRAASVHMTLTDHFLLVDEGTDYGFGLPIGWLSAAQTLTGVEPISLEVGDHLRVCYLDGSRVRGFTVRVRGGRFGSRSSRRANQLRAAAMSLGLASSTPSTNLLLPPEYDLSLNWDEFAFYESEPVIWSGRAVMPTGSGLESGVCDVWLTSASLIWGASSRAGICRIPTASLAAITATETPNSEDALYWTVTGSHQTQVDLPMIFQRSALSSDGSTPRECLLAVLEGLGHQVNAPTDPPQPWRTRIESGRVLEAVSVPMDASTTDIEMATDVPSSEADGTQTPDRPRASRRRLLEDGLFPDRVPQSLPRSTPLPWGKHVERPGSDAIIPETTSAVSPPTSHVPGLRPTASEPNADRLRIWPAAVPRRQSQPLEKDAAGMLVRRPQVRPTTTEEFLASERAARAAVADSKRNSSIPVESPVPSSERGIIVRFHRPQAALADLARSVQRSTEPDAARSTASFAVPKPEPSASGTTSPANAVAPVLEAPGLPEANTVALSREAPGDVHDETAGMAVTIISEQPSTRSPSGMPATIPCDESPYSVVAAQAAPQTPVGPSGRAIDRMRSALAGIDQQLSEAISTLEGLDTPIASRVARPDIGATTPFLTKAIAEIALAVQCGELGEQAAETHRAAIIRSADTTERLHSLLDLHARGYLTAAEIRQRRQALLGSDRSEG